MIRARRHFRLGYLVLAYACVGVGMAGIVVPLLPTTPFLLLAAWAGTRGSPRLLRWLIRHPNYGPMLKAWRRERAVPTRAKVVACILLLFSWVMLWATGMPAIGLTVLTVFFLGIAVFVLSRPTPSVHSHACARGAGLDG